MEDLTLGQIRKLGQIFASELTPTPEASTPKAIDGGVCIVVLQRGWVAVGRYGRIGDECTLTGASIVRQWGTTKGLPELAASGPTDKTVLDKMPVGHPIRFHRAAEVLVLDCVESKWHIYVA